jgi:hypothetical protein
MKYEEFKILNQSISADPLQLWFDDPGTTDSDMEEFLQIKKWLDKHHS